MYTTYYCSIIYTIYIERYIVLGRLGGAGARSASLVWIQSACVRHCGDALRTLAWASRYILGMMVSDTNAIALSTADPKQPQGQSGQTRHDGLYTNATALSASGLRTCTVGTR